MTEWKQTQCVLHSRNHIIVFLIIKVKNNNRNIKVWNDYSCDVKNLLDQDEHRLVACLAWSRLTLVINKTLPTKQQKKKKKKKGNNSANWANSLDIHCMSHSLFNLDLFLIKKVALMWRIFIITNVVFIVTFIFISTHSIKGIVKIILIKCYPVL